MLEKLKEKLGIGKSNSECQNSSSRDRAKNVAHNDDEGAYRAGKAMEARRDMFKIFISAMDHRLQNRLPNCVYESQPPRICIAEALNVPQTLEPKLRAQFMSILTPLKYPVQRGKQPTAYAYVREEKGHNKFTLTLDSHETKNAFYYIIDARDQNGELFHAEGHAPYEDPRRWILGLLPKVDSGFKYTRKETTEEIGGRHFVFGYYLEYADDD